MFVESVHADDDEPIEFIGEVLETEWYRAEVRIIGVGRLGFAIRTIASEPKQVILREVKTKGEVRRLVEALKG